LFKAKFFIFYFLFFPKRRGDFIVRKMKSSLITKISLFFLVAVLISSFVNAIEGEVGGGFGIDIVVGNPDSGNNANDDVNDNSNNGQNDQETRSKSKTRQNHGNEDSESSILITTKNINGGVNTEDSRSKGITLNLPILDREKTNEINKIPLQILVFLILLTSLLLLTLIFLVILNKQKITELK
tara:strand:+ start:1779 stop:2330 length:552 start_codon:yes stop_codon:yes gene_type:complete